MAKFECGEHLIAPFLCTKGALSPRFVSSWVFWLVSSSPKDEPSLDPSRPDMPRPGCLEGNEKVYPCDGVRFMSVLLSTTKITQ